MLFELASLFFGVEASLAAAFGGFGGDAWLWFDERAFDEVFEVFEATAFVLGLCAGVLVCDDEFAGVGDEVVCEAFEASFGVGFEVEVLEVDAEFDLGGASVDILAAGS